MVKILNAKCKELSRAVLCIHSLVTLLPGSSAMYNIIIIIGELVNCEIVELIAIDLQAR